MIRMNACWGTVSEQHWGVQVHPCLEKSFTISTAQSAVKAKIKYESLKSSVISERIKTIQNVY